MTTYTVLQVSSGGRLTPANYGEALPSYSAARAFARKTNFLFGIVRTDRVSEVCARYFARNN